MIQIYKTSSVTAQFTNPQEVVISHTDDSIKIGDGTRLMSVNANGSINTVTTGTVAVSNFPATQPVSGTVAVSNFPATQPVSGTISQTAPSLSSVTNVAGTTSTVTLLAANASRKAGYFYNNTGATMYLKLGTGATSSSKTLPVVAEGYYELPFPVYTGIITAAWATAAGSVDITELT